MKKLTSITLLNRPEGVTVSYTYSTIDEQGQVTERNVRKSYVILDQEELELYTKLEEKVNKRLQA